MQIFTLVLEESKFNLKHCPSILDKRYLLSCVRTAITVIRLRICKMRSLIIVIAVRKRIVTQSRNQLDMLGTEVGALDWRVIGNCIFHGQWYINKGRIYRPTKLVANADIYKSG